MKLTRFFLGISLSLAFCSPSIFGYQEPSQHSASAMADSGKRDKISTLDDSPLLVLDVNLVNLSVTVTDRDGRALAGLRKEDFIIYEDKVRQEISYFSIEDAPISVGILLDDSGSIMKRKDSARRAALEFVKQSNSRDSVFLAIFNQDAYLAQDFTNDFDSLTRAINDTAPGGWTALYDAIVAGIKKVKTGPNAKKTLLVVTDGEDNRSYTGFNELMRVAQESGVIIYIIGLSEESSSFRYSKTLEHDAQKKMQKLAEATGGRLLVPQSDGDMMSVATQIAQELRRQYSIGYTSTNQKKDGKWRKLKVDVKSSKDPKEAVVRTRAGYYAPKK